MQEKRNQWEGDFMLATLLLLIDSEEDQRKFEELYHQYKQLMFYVARDYFHKESADRKSIV